MARIDGFALVRAAYRQRIDYPGEEVSLTLPDDLQKLIRLRGEAESVAQAASEVNRQLAQLIIAKLGARGMTRVGPRFYQVSNPKKIKIRPDAQSRFWQWVKAHDMADRLFNPNDARTGGLADMKKLADPETGELLTPQQWDEAFLDIEVLDAHTLDVIPESRMRKWQLRFPDGYVQQGGPIEKETHDNDDGGKDESGGSEDRLPRDG